MNVYFARPGIFLLFAALTALAGGCATDTSVDKQLSAAFSGTFVDGFDREAATKRLCDLTPTPVPGENVPPKDAPIETPAKMAVYMDMETLESSGEFSRRWDWSDKDDKFFLSFLNQMVKKRILSEYYFLPRNHIPPTDIDGIFNQAQKDGASILMSVRSIAFVDKYFNPAGILDLTLIGAMWFPGSTRDALVFIRCDIWDIRNRQCKFSLWAEGLKRVMKPTFTIRCEDAFLPAKEQALINMIKVINEESHPSFDLKWNR